MSWVFTNRPGAHMWPEPHMLPEPHMYRWQLDAYSDAYSDQARSRGRSRAGDLRKLACFCPHLTR